MIGQPLRRLEDPRLIRGSGRFVDDMSTDGMLHAVFVRSIEAHALIRGIEVDPVIDGSAKVFSAADLGLEAPMPGQNPSPAMVQRHQAPPLATQEVCYVGQPVAVVVASSIERALDAAEAVYVDYEPLPAIVEYRRALEDDSPPAHQGSSSNLIATLTAGYGDVDAAFASAARTTRLTVDQHRGAGISMEGRAVFAVKRPNDPELTVWTSTQAPHHVKASLAAYLALSPDELRVVAPDVGGGFGPKAVVYAEEYVVTALARLLEAPVKWTERRREHLVATSQARGQCGVLDVAFDDDGRLLGLRAHFTHDCGAYASYGIVVPSTTLRLISGPYVIPAIDASVKCVYTNTTPTAAIRGAGRPNANFAIERALDEVAREVGIDRTEVRRRNFVKPSDMPYAPGLLGGDGAPMVYDSGDYLAALELALQTADLERFEERAAASAQDGLLRGYGVASYIEDTGVGPYDGARLEVLANGQVLLETGTGAQGQGHATVYSQICAHHLGVDPGNVKVRSGDTGRYGHGMSTVASRTGQTAASVVHLAAAELADLIRAIVAEDLEAAPEDVVLRDGIAMVAGQPGTEVPLGTIAAGMEARFGGRVAPGHGRPGLSVEKVLPFSGSAFTYGTHVAEVEIDPETGGIEVVGYTVVHDCGTLLNPMIVDGQIDGGVAHGLGNALIEQVRYAEDGQPLTTTLMDYLVPVAGDMPPLTKIHTETPAPGNPLGAKGAGEGGTIPAASAVASAVEHALSSKGVAVHHYPITREWIFQALSR